MKKELIDHALESLDAIIRDALDDTDPRKYTRIIAIAVQAHRMRKHTRRPDRVADHVGAQGMYVGGVPGGDPELHAAMNGELIPAGDAPVQDEVAFAGGLPLPLVGGFGGRGPRHLPDTGDLMDVLREALSTLRPTDDRFEKVTKRLRALREARSALHDAGGDTTAIDAQIRDLTITLTDLKEDPDAAATPHPALVHSELLRGHPSRSGGRDAVPRDRGSDDGARARGAQDAGEGGIEATVVADVEGTDATVQ